MENQVKSEGASDGQAGQHVFRLVLFQTGRQKDQFGNLNPFVFHRVQSILDRHLKTPPENTTIDVWLESPGGSATTAYKLFLEISHRCSKLRFIIPDYAKSAATLLALGGDEIFMAPAAELGPLDAQIGHPDREGVTISALDIANALGFLAGFAAEYTVAGGYDVLEWTHLPRVDVLREFSRFAAKLMEPMMSKLDPHLIHKAKNELELAKHYAVAIQKARHVQPKHRIKEEDLADHLVKNYPAHEFLVNRVEASESLGLPITNLETYDKCGEVKKLHRQFSEHTFINATARSIIRPWTEPTEADLIKATDRHPKAVHNDDETHGAIDGARIETVSAENTDAEQKE